MSAVQHNEAYDAVVRLLDSRNPVIAAIVRLHWDWYLYWSTAVCRSKDDEKELQELQHKGLDFTDPVRAIPWEDYKEEYQQEIAQRINRVRIKFIQTKTLHAKLANLVRHSYRPLRLVAEDSLGQTSERICKEFETLAVNAKSHSRWTPAEVSGLASALVRPILLTKEACVTDTSLARRGMQNPDSNRPPHWILIILPSISLRQLVGVFSPC